MGADCQLSPTAVTDTLAALARMRDAAGQVIAGIPPLRLPTFPPQGVFNMPTDPLTWLLWLMFAILAIAALAWWRWPRAHATEQEMAVEPVPVAVPTLPEWGREYKKAVGSAGIKSIVREGRMEEAYQVRTGSDTAFEAYADFDTQQER